MNWIRDSFPGGPAGFGLILGVVLSTLYIVSMPFWRYL